MTATAPPASTPQARQSGRGLVLAGDRQKDREQARRHSRRVRSLRIVLPVLCAVTLGLYGVALMNSGQWSETMAQLKVPRIIPEKLAMNNPYYEGFTDDGGRYWVRAKTAQQLLKNLNAINLETITGEMVDAKNQITRLRADRGSFDSKANVLELYDAINITGDDGLKAKLTRATVQTKAGLITSNEPVDLTMSTGNIRANAMTLRQKEKDYTFQGNVQTLVKPPPPDPGTIAQIPADASAKPATMFAGGGDGPIRITSQRLDVNDIKSTALFSGGVVAKQAEATLSTPELQVIYEGSALERTAISGDGDKTPDAGDAASDTAKPVDGQRGNLRRIIASNPVVIRQASGETVSAQSAEFDVKANTAVLDGGVTVTQLPDKRVTSQRATLDQTSGEIVLSGRVEVQQGDNALNGERLQFAQTSGRMRLTTPGNNGRIFANFVQNKPGQSKSKDTAKAKNGIPFGANFKSDPNAPVKIEATQLDVDDGAKTAVFVGDVRAAQGNFLLRARKMTAHYAGSAALGRVPSAKPEAKSAAAASLTRIEARDNVQITSADGQSAVGDWADIDTKANTATLGGNVVLTQGKNVVRGTKLLIDMTTGESVLKSDPGQTSDGWATSSDGQRGGSAGQGGRPSAVFYPGEMRARQKGGSTAKSGNDGWSARSRP